MSVDANAERRERNEKLSLRIVGICFAALAVYIEYEAMSDLIRKTVPEHSIAGIALACVSPNRHADSVTSQKEGCNALKSGAMKADARQTDFCVYLSGIVLVGLVLNAGLDGGGLTRLQR